MTDQVTEVAEPGTEVVPAEEGGGALVARPDQVPEAVGHSHHPTPRQYVLIAVPSTSWRRFKSSRRTSLKSASSLQAGRSPASKKPKSSGNSHLRPALRRIPTNGIWWRPTFPKSSALKL